MCIVSLLEKTYTLLPFQEHFFYKEKAELPLTVKKMKLLGTNVVNNMVPVSGDLPIKPR